MEKTQKKRTHLHEFFSVDIQILKVNDYSIISQCPPLVGPICLMRPAFFNFKSCFLIPSGVIPTKRASRTPVIFGSLRMASIIFSWVLPKFSWVLSWVLSWSPLVLTCPLSNLGCSLYSSGGLMTRYRFLSSHCSPSNMLRKKRSR